MNVPTMSLVAMVSSLASVILALAMFLLVLWQAPRHVDNQLMALYMIEVVFWGAMAFMVRFWTISGQDVTPFFYGIVLGIGFNGLFLFTLVSHYTGLWQHWWPRALLLLGFLYSIIIVPLVYQGKLYTDFSISPDGNLLFRFQPFGYVTFGVVFLFHLASMVTLWHFRKQHAGRVLLLGAVVISAGVLSSLSDLLMQYPVAIMAAGISTVFFAHAILREKLFNPLALVNEELTQANARLSQVSGELQVTNQQLVEANHLKSRFLAIMSHELRTPLNSIIGYTELLLQGVYGEMSEKQQDRLNKVMRNGQHLMQLINDILDLSKIESGHLQLDLEPVEIVSVIAECMTLFEPLAQKKGLDLLREVRPDLPWVMADKLRVLQILMNLISNAVKFTHVGHITVHGQILGGNDRRSLPPALLLPHDDWVLIGVTDTGIGIAPEDQGIVFDEFRQVDGSITREYEGTGLGLAITRKLVEMMNGHIWLESQLNQGSSFWFLLPIAAIEEQKLAEVNHSKIVAEDQVGGRRSS